MSSNDLYYEIAPYYSKSKVLQYFAKVRPNSATLDAFTEVVKVMNCEIPSMCDTL